MPPSPTRQTSYIHYHEGSTSRPSSSSCEVVVGGSVPSVSRPLSRTDPLRAVPQRVPRTPRRTPSGTPVRCQTRKTSGHPVPRFVVLSRSLREYKPGGGHPNKQVGGSKGPDEMNIDKHFLIMCLRSLVEREKRVPTSGPSFGRDVGSKVGLLLSGRESKESGRDLIHRAPLDPSQGRTGRLTHRDVWRSTSSVLRDYDLLL